MVRFLRNVHARLLVGSLLSAIMASVSVCSVASVSGIAMPVSYGYNQPIPAVWLLVWTDDEIYNDHFEVMRSDSASGPFSTIGTFPASAIPGDHHSYQFYDTTALVWQTVYYMIADVDSDGVRSVHTNWVPHTFRPGVGGLSFSFRPACPAGYYVWWTVQMEANVSGYRIQRAHWGDFNGLEEIAFVPTLGDTSGFRQYVLWDSTSMSYPLYYWTVVGENEVEWDPGWMFTPEVPWTNVDLDSLWSVSILGGIEVGWQTSLEYFIRCYRIKRARPGGDFSVVAEIAPGDNWEGGNYSFMDTTALSDTSYTFRLYYTRPTGEEVYMDSTAAIGGASSAGTSIGIAAAFTLSSYPNPFNPFATISFSLPQTQQIRLAVYDVVGREVAVLADEQYQAGEHRVTFDGTKLPSGIYFLRMEADRRELVRKLLLLK